MLTTDKKDSNKIIGEDLNLYEYLKQYGTDFLGSKVKKLADFPLLIKLIDAKQNLSIQVHPDDTYANLIGQPYGKTEMWYIVDTEENNNIIYGTKKEITKEEFKNSIVDNTIEHLLAEAEIEKGDSVYLPAGTIHAIKSGTIVFEVQQKSNTTYRIYDFDRKDFLGNVRELHIDESLEVSDLVPMKHNFKRSTLKFGDNKVTIQERNEYFTVAKVEVEKSFRFSTSDETFASIVILEGSGELKKGENNFLFKKGDSFLVAANSRDISLNGRHELMISYI